MSAMHAHFSCTIGVKLAVVAEGTGGQVLYSGVDVACLAVGRELAFHFPLLSSQMMAIF